MAGSRTWNCTVAPTGTTSPTATSAGTAIGAEHAADEEVASFEVESLLVHDDPAVQALGGELAVLGGERRR